MYFCIIFIFRNIFLLKVFKKYNIMFIVYKKYNKFWFKPTNTGGGILFYKPELNLLINTCQKIRLGTEIFSLNDNFYKIFNSDPLRLIGLQTVSKETLTEVAPEISSNTLYNLCDRLSRRFVFMLLPFSVPEQALVIGPYFSDEPSSINVLEISETMGLNPTTARGLEEYFKEIPIISESNSIFALIYSFAEKIWQGEDNFTVSEINLKLVEDLTTTPKIGQHVEPQTTAVNMRIMEKRYNYEKQFMEAVTKGQIAKIELLANNLDPKNFESRTADTVRNIKNYCIIMNTLLRKAAETGGVHPIYLNGISSDFAVKIELVTSTKSATELMKNMFRSYCLLVRQHSTKNFSEPVKQIINIINADLSANLNLSTLADTQKLNPSYVSTLFKRETGTTITEYINKKRIDTAKELLKTTNLQIQTVAQHCGILDVHYFSRLFKKHCGTTPMEYREKSKTV